ncbi:MAG: hypothetical protein ACOVOT_14090 [Rubrivivax sp.]|jgi:hypothetical protein|nr:hypothetical protein [Rubrivivax sp.]
MSIATVPYLLGLLVGAWYLLEPAPVSYAGFGEAALFCVLLWSCIQGWRRGFLHRRLGELHRNPITVGWLEVTCLLAAGAAMVRLHFFL